ncbi:NADH oxidase [Leucoagaricus sp. SymC.cos]|nr:NADH oxidase [Leucoagaricus sp. SymC.cos]
MYEHLSDFLGGPPTAYHIALYSSWSRYDWGMVITGNVQVSPSHLTLGRDLIVPEKLNDVSLKPYKALASAMKGPDRRTLAVMQLSHAGRQSSNFIGGRYPFERPLAPSAIPVGSSSSQDDPVAAMIQSVLFQTPKEMSLEDINDVVRRFVKGARLAHRTGFDGVELHVAHGYLLAQFLSPKSNKRKDEYSLRSENGLRLLHQIVDAIRTAVSPRFIIGVKFNASDYLPDTSMKSHRQNSDSEETRALQHVLSLASWGKVDFIDITGGDYEDPKYMATNEANSGHRQALFARFSRQALKALNAAGFKYSSRPAIILTGGLRAPSLLQSALQSGQTDMLGIGRGAVICPNIPEIMQEYEQSPRNDGGDTPFGDEPDLPPPTWWPLGPIWNTFSKIKLIGAGLNMAWYTLMLRRRAAAELRRSQALGKVDLSVTEPDYTIGALRTLIHFVVWMPNPRKRGARSPISLSLITAGGLFLSLLLACFLA